MAKIYINTDNTDGAAVWEQLVLHSLFDANTILAATTDNTPTALTVTEQTVVGRLTSGNIAAIALGIADNNIVQIDDADASSGQAIRFTANGIEGFSLLKVDTEANILATSAAITGFAYGTDTEQFYLADGANWRRLSLKMNAEPQAPDMGSETDSTKDGYYEDAITDKDISNSKIGSNANNEERSVRTAATGLQLYLNGQWNDLYELYLREDDTFGYVVEHLPIGFDEYIEVMTGNSLQNLGLNGRPITQQYKTSMGVYPAPQIIDGGTF